MGQIVIAAFRPKPGMEEKLLKVIADRLPLLRGLGLDLDEIYGIAITQGPGLIGSLLVGLASAKTISLALNKPLIGINHLEDHISALRLLDRRGTSSRSDGRVHMHARCVAGPGSRTRRSRDRSRQRTARRAS